MHINNSVLWKIEIERKELLMIKESFIFLKGVGLQKETSLWQSGIHDWDRFRESKTLPGITSSRRAAHERQLHAAEKALYSSDAEYFAKLLKPAHAWRLYDSFKEDAVFLDIETTGFYGDITVIGLYDGIETKTFVRGFTMDKAALKKELEKYKMIITFNGASFDLPIIEKYFQGVVPKIPHIDLRHVCSKIGLTGGLKNIERLVGLKRADAVANMGGADAVYLWRQWRATGNKEFLDLLVQYNEEDIVNLKPLAELAIPKVWKNTRRIT